MNLLPFLAFGPMAAAILVALIGKVSPALRKAVTLLTCAAVFGLCAALFLSGDAAWTLPGFCGLGLHLRADGFRSLYALIAAFMWLMTSLFVPEYLSHGHAKTRYAIFTLMTLGATLGVFLSDDLYTTFIFFEIMSFTSYAWVAHEENPGALQAAGTYLAVAIFGGLTTLMGLFLLYFRQGTLAFDALQPAADTVSTVAAWLVLVGFAAKAGLYPLHIWLPKAHPVAPAPASALLSGILTKSGVFGMIVICTRLMPGNAAFGNGLLVLACVTMFLGAVLALFSTDLKRTLACSSMSQIGFITVGLSMMVLLGEHGTLAAYGTVLHMVSHSLIKLTLFMAAGVIYMNVHALNLNEVRGFGRRKPFLHIAFLLGALSIMCIPGVGSAYASKSLLHEAILEFIAHQQAHGGLWVPYKAAELLFLVSGGLTIAYMLKLYICIFWEKHPTRQAEFDEKKRSMNPLSAFAVLGSALVLPALAVLPEVLQSPLAARSAAFLGQHAADHAIPYFSWANLSGALVSIVIGVSVYLLIVRPLLMKKTDAGRVYIDRWPAGLDLERLYSAVLMKWLPALSDLIVGTLARLPDSIVVLKVIPGVVVAFIRGLSELPERIVLLLSRTLFRKHHTRQPIPVGTRFTYTVGRCINAVARLLNKTFLHRRPMRTDFEYLLAASWREVREDTRTMTVSISFGLLLLCIGLFLTCLYLLR